MAITPPTKPLHKNPFRRYKNLPVIGPWIGRVGRVRQILSHPCQPTPEIWVYAFFWNLPIAIFSLFSPSDTDFLAERFGTGGRGKKKFKMTYWQHLAPEVNPGNGLGWYAFRGVALLRMVGWYFTIADSVTGLGVNWVSTAYRWQGCVPPGGSWAQQHLLADSVELLGAGEVIVSTWILDGAQGMGTDQAAIAVSSSQQASVGFGVNAKPNEFGLPDATFTARLVELGSGLTVAEGRDNGKGAGEQSSQGYYANGYALTRNTNKFLQGGTFVVVVTKSFGAIQWASGHFSANSSPSSDAILPGLFDPRHHRNEPLWPP